MSIIFQFYVFLLTTISGNQNSNTLSKKSSAYDYIPFSNTSNNSNNSQLSESGHDNGNNMNNCNNGNGANSFNKNNNIFYSTYNNNISNSTHDYKSSYHSTSTESRQEGRENKENVENNNTTNLPRLGTEDREIGAGNGTANGRTNINTNGNTDGTTNGINGISSTTNAASISKLYRQPSLRERALSRVKTLHSDNTRRLLLDCGIEIRWVFVVMALGILTRVFSSGFLVFKVF